MIQTMAHRGPDAADIYTSGDAMLAHRRLSILDLSPTGRQPMANEDGSVRIVFNGEIYNYLELRDLVDNYTYRSETDTEVLLHLYEEFGIDCLEKLRGMYAFAILDEDADRLVLARDRLGQKPLFYRHTDDGFWFGSTISAILADEEVPTEPDYDALRSFLTYQYVPSPATGFRGIKQLQPGEYGIYEKDEFERRSYWELSFSDKLTATPEDLAERLRSELREATRLRMRSDVPLGVFLSGGIDSTIVTAMMSELSETPINTYSIGFDTYDELDFARTVADEYGTEHHEQMVTPDAMSVLPELIDHYEMPFGDPSAVPTYYVSKTAAEDITVAVGGDAGDENFGGYDRYTYDRMTSAASKIPDPVRQLGIATLNAASRRNSEQSTLSRGKRLLENAGKDPVERYAQYICHMDSREVDAIWSDDESTDTLSYLRDAFDSTDGPTRMDHIMQVDIDTYLPEDVLVKVDRASMAHSLEVRSPFLDHKLVEFAAQIPAKYKWRRGKKKWLLKRAFEDYIPKKIQNRSKQGFSVPVDAWFRSELREDARTAVDRLGNRSVFDERTLKKIYRDHTSGRKDRGFQLWDLLVLDAWFERFF
jgi:asparagine synthase (glutamine-hydrolysing)